MALPQLIFCHLGSSTLIHPVLYLSACLPAHGADDGGVRSECVCVWACTCIWLVAWGAHAFVWMQVLGRVRASV